MSDKLASWWVLKKDLSKKFDLISWEGKTKRILYFWSGKQWETEWKLVVSYFWDNGLSMLGYSSWSAPLLTLPTLMFSPEQGQSAAKIEGPDTAVLEQRFELGMKERKVSRWAKEQGRTKVVIGGWTLEAFSPIDSRFSLWYWISQNPGYPCPLCSAGW